MRAGTDLNRTIFFLWPVVSKEMQFIWQNFQKWFQIVLFLRLRSNDWPNITQLPFVSKAGLELGLPCSKSSTLIIRPKLACWAGFITDYIYSRLFGHYSFLKGMQGLLRSLTENLTIMLIQFNERSYNLFDILACGIDMCVSCSKLQMATTSF